MTTNREDLELLPESVRDAIRRTEVTVEMFDTLVTVDRDDWDAIRAELLRFASENMEFRKQVADWRSKAATFESELAALRQKIAEAITVPVVKDMHDTGSVFGLVRASLNERLIGKRVALLPLDDGGEG